MKRVLTLVVTILCFTLSGEAQSVIYTYPKPIKMDMKSIDSLMFNSIQFKKIFTYLKAVKLDQLAPGRYQICKDEIYMLIVEDTAKTPVTAILEGHRVYTDIQIPIKGDLVFGLSPQRDCTIIRKSYSDQQDVAIYEDTPQKYVKVSPGELIIFTPRDAHATDIGHGRIKKAVIKVKL